MMNTTGNTVTRETRVDGRIRIDVPIGTPLFEVEVSAIQQTVSLCEGNRQRAARRLDITVARVNRFLNLARSGDQATTQTGFVDARSVPSNPGERPPEG
jgi:DNA-binding NtrC family response regulator